MSEHQSAQNEQPPFLAETARRVRRRMSEEEVDARGRDCLVQAVEQHQRLLRQRDPKARTTPLTRGALIVDMRVQGRLGVGRALRLQRTLLLSELAASTTEVQEADALADQVPEWRNALRQGDRVLVVRVDDDENLYGGTIHLESGLAMIRIAFPESREGQLDAVDWYTVATREVWDEDTGRHVLAKLTCAL